jgi:hypothetical protein
MVLLCRQHRSSDLCLEDSAINEGSASVELQAQRSVEYRATSEYITPVNQKGYPLKNH